MRYTIPIDVINLEQENYHLILKSDFGDGIIGNWVIDTGASKSVFDQNLIAYYVVNDQETEELHSAGTSEEPITTTIGDLKLLYFGKLKVENIKVALLDMAHINEHYSKVSDLRICGLLGSDFLLKYKAVIDYKRERIILSS